jgi:hypothetical protein
MNPSKVQIRIVTEDEITTKAANFSLSSCPPVKVEGERLSAREAANVCRDLEAYLNRLLPKERSQNLQVFVPTSITDEEGNTLTPSGKLAKRDDFLSAPSAKEKKVKKVENVGCEKLVHHVTTMHAFAMIKVALPLTIGDLPASLALVEQARAAFEARANARVEREDKEDREGAAGNAATVVPVKVALPLTIGDLPASLALVEQPRAAFEARANARVEREDKEDREGAAGNAATVVPVKSIEREPAICSQDRATAVFNATIYMIFVLIFLALSVKFLTLTGVVARADAKKFFASDELVYSFVLSVCMTAWAIKNGWVQNPESFMPPFRFLFKTIVQRIS